MNRVEGRMTTGMPLEACEHPGKGHPELHTPKQVFDCQTVTPIADIENAVWLASYRGCLTVKQDTLGELVLCCEDPPGS